MKKTVASLLSFVLVLALFTSTISALGAEDEPLSTITYFEDGSYCISTITTYKDWKQPLPLSQSSTTSGTKSSRYYNSNNSLQFTVFVYGTFEYTGASATATSAQYGYTISNNAWHFTSGSASCSGASSTASCTFHAIAAGSKTASVTLTCSATGVLS